MRQQRAVVCSSLWVLASACAVLSASAQTDAIPAHTSIGSAQDGSLAGGGVALPLRGAGFHWLTNRGNPGARFATPSLVAALVRAAADVARAHPGSDLAIHDLSLSGGGSISGHGSHTSGRDVDIAYYARSRDGTRIDPTTSLWFLPTGEARDRPLETAPVFDAERTWRFLATLLGDSEIRVQYVFAHPAIQRFLLAEARRQHSRAPLVAAATRVLRTPRGRRMDPHADHFHVRIQCPARDVPYGCRDGR